MKKIALLLAAAVLLAACNQNNPGKNTEETKSQSQSESSQPSDTPSSETLSDTPPGEAGNAGENETDNVGGDSGTVSVRLYNAVIADREIPIMMPPYLEEMVPDFIGDPENTESFVIQQAAISAILTEIIIAEAKEGKTDDVYNAVNAHYTALKDSNTLYPQGMAAVAAAVIGKNGNIVYFICSEDAADMERALLEAIK